MHRGKEPESDRRPVRMATSASEYNALNHYVPLVPSPWAVTKVARPPNPPCDGSLCSRQGDACVARLVNDTLVLGMAPINVVADGNLGPATVLFFDGVPRTMDACQTRWQQLSQLLGSHAADPTWQEAFQLLGEIGSECQGRPSEERSAVAKLPEAVPASMVQSDLLLQLLLQLPFGRSPIQAFTRSAVQPFSRSPVHGLFPVV